MKFPFAAFSVNYFIPEDDLTINDPNKTLKVFVDSKTASGNVIEVFLSVILQSRWLLITLLGSATFVRTVEGRFFPLSLGVLLVLIGTSAIFTKTPKAPGKVFLKATLFDTVSPKGGEVFAEKRLELWGGFASRIKYILLHKNPQSWELNKTSWRKRSS